MSKPKDLTNKVFHHLTALAMVGSNPPKWNCKCVCGKELVVIAKKLGNKSNMSCGCMPIPVGHGYCNTPTYRLWQLLIKRCHSKTFWQYGRFGELGTKLHLAWRESFVCFLKDVGQKPKDKTIVLIDPKGDFAPGNWKWSSTTEAKNTRKDSVRVLDLNVLFTISAFAKKMGISKSSVYKRNYTKVRLSEQSVGLA